MKQVISMKSYGELLQKKKAPVVSLKTYASKNIDTINIELREIKFIISTNAVDGDNSRIFQNNWDLEAYKLNPVVLWDHDASKLPIGKCTWIGVEGGQLKAVVQFATAELNPMAEAVYQMVLGGYINATSVGFLITDRALNEERSEYGKPAVDILGGQLREFSIVSVPCNPECVIEPGQRFDVPVEVEASLENLTTKANNESKKESAESDDEAQDVAVAIEVADAVEEEQSKSEDDADTDDNNEDVTKDATTINTRHERCLSDDEYRQRMLAYLDLLDT